MTILGGWGKRLAWLLAVLAVVVAVKAPVEVQGQQLAGANNLAQGPALPPPPPMGAWGEVIMANNRWMVVQNQLGQQFPIANDAVAQFLIRWPTQLDALNPGNSVIEALGLDLGSNTVAADHVDVFEGGDQNLVTPTATSLLPNNRFVTAIDPGFQRMMNAFEVGAQNLLHGWAYPVNAGINGIPGQIHVVGPVLNVVPLQLGIPGNNFVSVLPNDSMTMTRVTRGNTSYAEKGDLVFLMPLNLTTRTVVLSQAVLYKKMRITEFRLR